jgi:hypothetical protein
MGNSTGTAGTAAALLALAVLAVGCGADADADAGSGTDSVRMTDAELLACAELVAEGTVLRVTPGEGPDRVRVELEVDRYLKGDRGTRRLTFPVDYDEEGERPVTAGSRLLVNVMQPGGDTAVYQGEDIDRAREWMEKALPRSRALRCGEREYEREES